MDPPTPCGAPQVALFPLGRLCPAPHLEGYPEEAKLCQAISGIPQSQAPSTPFIDPVSLCTHQGQLGADCGPLLYCPLEPKTWEAPSSKGQNAQFLWGSHPGAFRGYS